MEEEVKKNPPTGPDSGHSISRWECRSRRGVHRPRPCLAVARHGRPGVAPYGKAAPAHVRPQGETRALIWFTLSEYLMYTLQNSSPPSNLQAIFKVKIHINFAKPADDATMAPVSASSLRTHLSPCPLSRLCGTKPLRRTNVDTESDTPLHLRATSSQGLLQKRCHQQGERHRASPSSDLGDPNLGFPPEQHYLQPTLMSTHASVLVDSVGPPSAEVYRAAVSFP
jgi:hypothetical protein